MATTLKRYSSSALSRNSKAVFDDAQETPVVIERRDGEDLILAPASEVEKEREFFALAAHLVAIAVSDDNSTFIQRLEAPFPWITLLTGTERHLFAQEIVEQARAAFSIRAPHPLLRTIAQWQATAEGHAAGVTNDSITIDFDSATQVERPA